jgi:Protein required for attachment to host cells
MRKQWIVVANGSLVRIHGRSGLHDPLVALETIEFPEDLLGDSGFPCDPADPESIDNGSAAAPFDAHTLTRNRLSHEFARELAKRLEEGVVDREYETFWLIASSPLLTEIKACLNRGVTHRLQWTHGADFTGLDATTLEKRLRELQEPRGPDMPGH